MEAIQRGKHGTPRAPVTREDYRRVLGHSLPDRTNKQRRLVPETEH